MTKTWPERMRVAEACLYSGLGDQLIRQLIRRGVLTAYRPTARRTMIEKASLDAYLASVRLPAAAS